MFQFPNVGQGRSMLFPLTVPGDLFGWLTSDSDLRNRGQYPGKDAAR